MVITRVLTYMKDETINVIVAGDFSPKERVQEIINGELYHNLFPLFDNVERDAFIVNYETVVASDKDKPIIKSGAHLRTNEKSIDALKWLGVDLVTLANNHFMDYGESAAVRTLKLFGNKGIKHVGVGFNLDEARIWTTMCLKGIKVAIINACEHEFSIAGEKQFGCNPIDIIPLSNQIKAAKLSSDFVICILHGGNEHFQLPSPRMKELYRFLVDCGSDAVINHHQHCFSGYEVYKEKPIFYGIGNFCFDSSSDNKYRHSTWNYGFMVRLELNEGQVGFSIIPYEQCWKTPGTFVYQEEKDIKDFNNTIERLNAIIADNSRLTQEYKKMAYQRKDFVYSGFMPYTSHILMALYSRGFIPSFLSKKRLTQIKAILDCEAHYDILMYNLSEDDLSSKPKL